MNLPRPCIRCYNNCPTTSENTMSDVMRQTYRQLSTGASAAILEIKQDAAALYSKLESLGSSRELSLAKTKLEEVVMWATKHLS